MRRRIAATLALGLFALAAGCVQLGRYYPEKRHYVIEARRPGPSAESADAPALVLRKFTVSPAFERVEFVYRRSEQAFEADFYSAFFAPPDEMIADETAQWLAGAGLFSHATHAATRLDAPYLLEGHLVSLYGDLRDPKAPRAVMELALLLVFEPSKGGEPRVVFHRTYREDVSVADAGADSMAQGFSTALKRILERLESDLRKAL